MKPDKNFVAEQADRVYDLLRQRAAVPREDLEYLVERVSKLKDARLQQVVAELIGWGDDERAELETFVAIAIEVMRRSTVSKLREAARIVELRHYSKGKQNELLALPASGRTESAAEAQAHAGRVW